MGLVHKKNNKGYSFGGGQVHVDVQCLIPEGGVVRSGCDVGLK